MDGYKLIMYCDRQIIERGKKCNWETNSLLRESLFAYCVLIAV